MTIAFAFYGLILMLELLWLVACPRCLLCEEHCGCEPVPIRVGREDQSGRIIPA